MESYLRIQQQEQKIYWLTRKDQIFHNNKRQGVWIGKRTIEGFGLSTYALQLFNSNILHYAVMINGKAFHLYGEKGNSLGSGTHIKITKLNQDFYNFEWFYKGKAELSVFSVQKLIDKVNKAQHQYHLIMANCQDVAKALSFYARGAYTEQVALQMIFPQSNLSVILQGAGLKRVGQVIWEGVNLIIP